MKVKLLIYLAALTSAVLIHFSCGDCSKKIDCPGFSDTLLTALFPYSDNQQLVFETDSNQKEIVTLKNINTTKPYQATSGALGPMPICTAEKVFQSTQMDTSYAPAFSVNLQVMQNVKEATIHVHHTTINFANITDTSMGYISINYFPALVQKHQTLVVGNRTFTNMLTGKKDTTYSKQPGIYQIYYTKGEGLVGYTEYPSLKTWVKQ